MTKRGGIHPSNVRAAEVALRVFIERGATYLGAKLASLIASIGENCWLTDRTCADVLKRSDGRRYHRGSIGRVRRWLARKRWIESKRIYPSQHLPSGRRSSQGTTNKRIDWKVLGVRSPMTRPEKREGKTRHEAIDRQIEEAPRRRVALDPAFVAMVAGIGAAPPAPRKVITGRSRPHPVSSSTSSGTIEERQAAALRWLREHPDGSDERGPP